MIDIIREDSKIIIAVDSGLPIPVYTFKMDIGHDNNAFLLRSHLREQLSYKLEQIRREAYNEGWKDAKARTKKETWFKGWW